MSADPSVARAATALFDARSSRAPIQPISETFEVTDPELAYAVQEANTARWVADGRKLVGRKIGLTSEAVQRQLGVDQPDYGMLWGDLGFESGAVVPIERFLQPRVEAEVAFVMASALDTPDATLEDVAGAIAHAVAADESVDSAIADWKITLADTIADNASGGGFVLGTDQHELADIDLEGCRMALSQNGTVVSEGVGSACLGNPLNAVLWLARKMEAVGRPLSQGDVVLSGALGPMVDARAGDRIYVEIQGFAPLELDFRGAGQAVG